MALADDLKEYVESTFKSKWETRDGKVVPAPKDIALKNEAVAFEAATVLYADLSGSTSMVQSKKWEFASGIYKTFLYCAARLINSNDGNITAYDGDRVMGVFIGADQCKNAARCALKINGAVKDIIMPSIQLGWKTDFVLDHVVGVDTSKIHVTRTGVRGDNDLVWVGRAANYAAKLTELSEGYQSWITKDVYDKLSDAEKFGGKENKAMWESRTWKAMNDMSIYRSNWKWGV